jgi:hypothetical protein
VAKFRVLEKSFINGVLCEPGDIVEHSGEYAENLEPSEPITKRSKPSEPITKRSKPSEPEQTSEDDINKLLQNA